MSDNILAVMALKVIAAKAEKLAYDLERNRLWEGELSQGVAEIYKALQDIKERS